VESESAKPPIVFDGLPRLIAAIKGFETQAAALDASTDALTKREGANQAQFGKVNDALTKVERAFLLPKGLPGRPWFKHSIYAPGLTTGYASWTLPGLRQAIIDNDQEMLNAQLPALVERIEAATAALKLATDAANPGNVPVAAPQPAGAQPQSGSTAPKSSNTPGGK
jgi:N-acetylated-alpha-linked acidic dipeptidase